MLPVGLKFVDLTLDYCVQYLILTSGHLTSPNILTVSTTLKCVSTTLQFYITLRLDLPEFPTAVTITEQYSSHYGKILT